VLHVARWKCSTQKIAKSSPSGHHHTTLSAISAQLRHASTVGKKLVKQQYLPTCSHNMANFDPLKAEICWRVWGTQQISMGFASCLRYCSDVDHRRPNILHDFRGLLSPDKILPDAKFTLRPNLAFAYIGNVTARHSSTGRQRNFVALSRGRQVYSTGRPSRWASARILVYL